MKRRRNYPVTVTLTPSQASALAEGARSFLKPRGGELVAYRNAVDALDTAILKSDQDFSDALRRDAAEARRTYRERQAEAAADALEFTRHIQPGRISTMRRRRRP